MSTSSGVSITCAAASTIFVIMLVLTSVTGVSIGTLRTPFAIIVFPNHSESMLLQAGMRFSCPLEHSKNWLRALTGPAVLLPLLVPKILFAISIDDRWLEASGGTI